MSSKDGFLGSFLSKGLKTNQLELNTDEKTLRPIARLKEPRDLFALPKDKDHDCPQQAPRWPIECQVIEERIVHINYVPTQPEGYNHSTGCELKPRPVGEENGVVVYNYNPISAVNYDSTRISKMLPTIESSDSDITSSESRGSSTERSTPDRRKTKFTKMIKRSSSNSLDDDEDDDDDDKYDAAANITPTPEAVGFDDKLQQQIDDIWANKTPEYPPISPSCIKNQFGKDPFKFSGITAKAISPVRIDPAQLARLNLVNKTAIRSSSSSSGCSTDDSDEEYDLDIDISDVTLSYRSNKKGRRHSRSTLKSKSILKLKSESKSNLKSTSSDSTSKSDIQIFQDMMAKLQQKNIERSPPLPIDALNITESQCSNSTITKNSKNINHTIIDQLSQPQFSRSAVGGSKFLTNCHPYNPEEYDGLEFESRFESGNLARAIKITETYYELYLRPDLYTSRSKQWFYFRVRKTKKNITYRFSIVNLVKSDSLYNDGMRPLMYSTINAKQIGVGWSRCGENICYYRNDDESSNEDDEDNSSYTLTFNVEFAHDNDTVFFAHSYPYTYSELQDYLMEIQKNPVKSKFCKLRLLCRSLAGNNVYYLTVTAPTNDEEAMKRKKSIVVSARVHPSETPSSWMMKGLMDFITGDSSVAKRLRHKFIFKLIPMLNPDGVIVGNTRNSLTGKDLNRQYRTVIRETYPSIWYTKAMIKRLIDECGVSMYCDMHAHSRKHNIFIYGCENKRNPDKKLTEQVFPLMMHKNVADKFSFESCKFKIQRSKEGTGRIVVWMLGITNSYTIEASFGGSSLGSRKGTHFTTADYEQMGRAFCETLLDYCDENPNKVKKCSFVKVFKQIKKIRRREKREKKALKLKKLAEQERLRLKIIERLLKEGSSADEPLNIPLSDYSSDEGDTSSSSDNEGKSSITMSDLEGPCCASLRAPPSSPELRAEMRRFKFKRMRKIMHELDRIYFQPLFQRKLKLILRKQNIKEKGSRKKGRDIKRLEGGGIFNRDSTDLIDTASNCTGNSVKTGKGAGAGGGDVGLKKSEIKERKHKQKSVQALRLRKCENKYINMVEKLMPSSKKSDEGQLQTTMSSVTQKSVSARSRNSKKKKKKKVKKTLSVELLSSRFQNYASERVKVSRTLRLWLAMRRIIIYRQRRKNRKSKMRSKSSQGNRKKTDAQRTPLDMPTTDPGSDLHFSTDDECGVAMISPMSGDIYATLPRPRRILLQSDLQRRYIEEISDVTPMKHMPPELIVTSPSKQPTSSAIKQQTLSFKPVPRTPDKGLLTEFPMIGGPARRTSSWHNLHNSSKCLPKLKVQNPQEFYQKDDLQVKLSLKKKIWTGVQPEQSSNFVERNRPLSWGVPPLGTQTKKETNNTLTTRSIKKDENEELLTACSQKLLAWQHDSIYTPTIPKNKLNVNLQVPDINTEAQALRVFKQLTTPRRGSTKQESNEGKNKRKKNTLSKVAETNKLAACLTRRKSRAIHSSTQRQTKGGNATQSNNLHAVSGYKMVTQQGNRFKTSGIVATAVQPCTKKNKKLLSLITNTNTSSSSKTAPTSHVAKVSKSPNITNTERHHNDDSGSTFVRKVKTKLKKKKSVGNLAAAMTLSQACAAGISVNTKSMSKKNT